MAMESYEIDSNGDVVLVLRNPRPSFAPWDEAQNSLSSSPDPSEPDLIDEVFALDSTLSKKEVRSRRKRVLRDLNDSEHPVPVPESDLPVPVDNLPEALEDPPEPIDSPPELLDSPPESLDSPPESLDNHPQAIDDLLEYGKTGPELLEDGSRGPESPDGVKIRVSSRHLILASPYFRNMLKREWKEGKTLQTDKFVEVEVEDVDADALVTVMNIIHGKTRSVPKTVDLEMLAKIAVVVDIYECAEAVEVFTDMWLAHLRSALPSKYSRDAVLWICISWVFRQHDEFRSATSAALKFSSGPIQDLGLPIPQSLVGTSHSTAA